jgi:hypothetical protein
MIIYIYLLLYQVSTGRIISRLERAGALGPAKPWWFSL